MVPDVDENVLVCKRKTYTEIIVFFAGCLISIDAEAGEMNEMFRLIFLFFFWYSTIVYSERRARKARSEFAGEVENERWHGMRANMSERTLNNYSQTFFIRVKYTQFWENAHSSSNQSSLPSQLRCLASAVILSTAPLFVCFFVVFFFFRPSSSQHSRATNHSCSTLTPSRKTKFFTYVKQTR